MGVPGVSCLINTNTAGKCCRAAQLPGLKGSRSQTELRPGLQQD